MFDTPDLMPLCVAPILALTVGALVYVLGKALKKMIEKRTGEDQPLMDFITLLSVVIVVPVACYASLALEIGIRSPAPWIQPSTNDIVGKWELSKGSAETLQKTFHVVSTEGELVFNQDGTFQLKSMPTFWGLSKTPFPQSQKYISGNGTWYLGQMEGSQRLEWAIFAQFQNINDKPENRSMRFYFEGHLAPYSLVAMDNDNSVYYRYEKR
ncbi:MAG: hypothetical protein HY741_12020 [Chloroflexi bacterium]|nr:hypothetical protein [Chloroflexota bacterium]